MVRWLTELNGTGRPILFSNCRNGCLNDDEGADMQWQPWCTDTVNMVRRVARSPQPMPLPLPLPLPRSPS